MGVGETLSDAGSPRIRLQHLPSLAPLPLHLDVGSGVATAMREVPAPGLPQEPVWPCPTSSCSCPVCSVQQPPCDLLHVPESDQPELRSPHQALDRSAESATWGSQLGEGWQGAGGGGADTKGLIGQWTAGASLCLTWLGEGYPCSAVFGAAVVSPCVTGDTPDLFPFSGVEGRALPA